MANTLNGRLTPTNNMRGALSNEGRLTGQLGGVGAAVTYASLPDKPSINGVTLVGNKTTSDLNINYNDLKNLPSIPDVGEIDERLDNLEGNITSLGGRVTTAEGNITSLSGRVTTNEGDISDLQGDTGALNTRLTTAEGDITSLGGRVTTAEGNITSLGGRVTTAEGNITSLGGRVTTAEGNITSLDGRVTTNEGNISDLQGDMSQAQSDISELNSRLTNVQSSIQINRVNIDNDGNAAHLLHSYGVYFVVVSNRHNSSMYCMGIASWHPDIDNGKPMFTTLNNNHTTYSNSNALGTLAFANATIYFRAIAIKIGSMD